MQVADRSDRVRARDVRVLVRAGVDHDVLRRVPLMDRTGRLDAVATRHGDVHQHHVRRVLLDEPDRLDAAREGGFAGGFFALYVPSPSVPDPTETPYALPLPDPVPHEEAARVAEELFACLLGLPVTLATSAADFQNGRVAAIAHLEGA